MSINYDTLIDMFLNESFVLLQISNGFKSNFVICEFDNYEKIC